MIEYLKGKVTELTPARMVMECSGVGYELQISLTTYTAFDGATKGNEDGKVLVYEIIRDDAHLLFGFADRSEREWFKLLISVSGVGPNTARMILSSLPPSELMQAILSRNEGAFTEVKGIGLKTAQRILVDLKNKVKNVDGAFDATSSHINISDTAEQAIEALVMLGFPRAISQKTVQSIIQSSPALSVEQLIKTTLRML